MTDNIVQHINEESIFDGGEFVLTRKIVDNKDPEFLSGGYKINSFFLQNEMSPLTTFNNGSQTGGKVSSPFENLVVPAGLFYINQHVSKNNIDNQEYYYKKHDMVSDDIMDKLFGLVQANKKQQRKTRKNINKQDKRKSRRINK